MLEDRATPQKMFSPAKSQVNYALTQLLENNTQHHSNISSPLKPELDDCIVINDDDGDSDQPLKETLDPKRPSNKQANGLASLEEFAKNAREPNHHVSVSP